MRWFIRLVCLITAIASGFMARPAISRLYHRQSNPAAVPDLTTPLEPTNFHRHLAFVRQMVDVGEVASIWLGDSITEGWRDSPDLWQQCFPGSINHGISWDRVEHTHWRVANGELGCSRPLFVVLMIGTNNISRGDSAEATAEGIRALLAVVHDKVPGAKILLLGVLPRTPVEMMPSVRDLNVRLAALADGNRVRFLDVGERFVLADGSLNLSLLPDGIHPSPLGYEVMGKAVGPALRQ
jgi:hypothetical protein